MGALLERARHVRPVPLQYEPEVAVPIWAKPTLPIGVLDPSGEYNKIA